MELSTAVVDKLSDFHDIAKHEDFLRLWVNEPSSSVTKTLTCSTERKREWFCRMAQVRAFPKQRKEEKEDDTPQLLVVGKDFNKKKPCIITEETIGMYIFPDCCHPIPGDDILGFIDGKTVSRSTSVHVLWPVNSKRVSVPASSMPSGTCTSNSSSMLPSRSMASTARVCCAMFRR